VYIGAGHDEGRHAPGDRLAFREVLRAGHHTLLAHGRSVQAIRASARSAPQIGFAPVGLIKCPATGSAEDVAAARSATLGVRDRTAWTNTWWMDPVYLGSYPADGWRAFGSDVPPVKPGDLEVIRQELDFFGVNIYESQTVRAVEGGHEVVARPVGFPISAFEWGITPEAAYWGPKFFWERYKKPIVITENGISCRDWVSLDGKVHDPNRIDFMQRYLREFRRAAGEGVDTRAYFHWSFIDNFEWAHGYKHRFGLVYCDYPTQRRIPKDSAEWYSRLIASKGALL
jgi:beta-glucosidase